MGVNTCAWLPADHVDPKWNSPTDHSPGPCGILNKMELFHSQLINNQAFSIILSHLRFWCPEATKNSGLLLFPRERRRQTKCVYSISYFRGPYDEGK